MSSDINDLAGQAQQKINAQHEEIKRILADILECAKNNRPLLNLYDNVRDLVNLLNIHFADENAIMVMCKYPHLAKHMLEHKKIFEEINGQFQALKKGDKTVSPLLAEYLIYLDDNHIAGADRDMLAYISGLSG